MARGEFVGVFARCVFVDVFGRSDDARGLSDGDFARGELDGDFARVPVGVFARDVSEAARVCEPVGVFARGASDRPCEPVGVFARDVSEAARVCEPVGVFARGASDRPCEPVGVFARGEFVGDFARGEFVGDFARGEIVTGFAREGDLARAEPASARSSRTVSASPRPLTSTYARRAPMRTSTGSSVPVSAAIIAPIGVPRVTDASCSIVSGRAVRFVIPVALRIAIGRPTPSTTSVTPSRSRYPRSWSSWPTVV